MNSHKPTHLLDPLFTTDAVRDIFCDQARLQRMLDFIAALARAEAAAGVIPRSAVSAVESQCRAELFDVEALARAAATAGNLAIPLVKDLTARVTASDATAAGFVYWGATSQDVIDSGLVLQLRDALRLIAKDLSRLGDALAVLAESHKRTVMAGRTWLQQATPITLGLKAASWLSAIDRHRARLRELEPRTLVLQFGGAAGTLAALGEKGTDVAEALAKQLGLTLPDSPWHTQRDRVAEVATVLGLIVGTLGKIGRDVASMTQTELGETFEPQTPGRGGSSTMPHKRNPVGSAVALAAATRVPALVSTMLTAMVQEHERGLGGWQAEWETLPMICELSAGALAHVIQVVEGLEVDAERMRANLDVTRGLIFAEAVTMALGRHIGRMPAHRVVESACRDAVEHGKNLRDVLAADPQVKTHLTGKDFDKLFDPLGYLGSTEKFVARVLSEHRRLDRGNE